jgi:hypothetical protein
VPAGISSLCVLSPVDFAIIAINYWFINWKKLKCLKKCCYNPDDEQLAKHDALILEWHLRVIVGHY